MSIRRSEAKVTRFIGNVGGHSIAPFLCALVSCGAVSAAVMMAQAPAASAAKSDCTSLNFCLWHDGSFSGTMWSYNQATNGSNQWNPVASAAYDQSSSAYNNRQHSADIGGNCANTPSGLCTFPLEFTDCMLPGGYREHLSNYYWNPPSQTYGENDSIAYYDLLNSVTTC